MPDFGTLTPPQPLTSAQRRAEAPPAPDVGFGEALTEAFTNGFTGSVVRAIDGTGFPADDGFVLTQKLLDDYFPLDTVSPDLRQLAAGARSLDHLGYLSAQAMQIQDSRGVLARAGMAGSAAKITAGVLDPIMLGTAMVAGPEVYGALGGTAEITTANLVRSGIANAGVFAGLTEAHAAVDPSVTQRDVLLSAAGGLGMGPAGLAMSRLTGISGVAARFLGVGAAGSLPSMALDYATADQDRSARAILTNGAIQFLLNGSLGMLHASEDPGHLEMRERVEHAADATIREAQLADLREYLARTGQVNVTENGVDLVKNGTITPQGEQYFSEALDPTARENLIRRLLEGGPDDEGPSLEEIDGELSAAREHRARAAQQIVAESATGLHGELSAAAAEREAARLKAAAEALPRTPIDLGGGVGFLPDIVHPNQVTGWARESPDTPRSFEAARADAREARRANPSARVVLVQERDGSYGAYSEPARGRAEGFQPGAAPGEPAAVLAQPLTARPEPVSPRGEAAHPPAAEAPPEAPTPALAEPAAEKPPTAAEVAHTPLAAAERARQAEVPTPATRLAKKLQEHYERRGIRVRWYGGEHPFEGFIHPGEPGAVWLSDTLARGRAGNYGADRLIEIGLHEATHVADNEPATEALLNRLANAIDPNWEESGWEAYKQLAGEHNQELLDGVNRRAEALAMTIERAAANPEIRAQLQGGLWTSLKAVVAKVLRGMGLGDKSTTRVMEAWDNLDQHMLERGRGMAGGKPAIADRPELSPAKAPGTPRPAKQPGDLDLSGVTDARSMFLLRADMPGMVGKSPVSRFRRAASMLGRDPLPKEGYVPTNLSAKEWMEERTTSVVGRQQARNDAMYGRYVKETRATGADPLTREDWAKQVTMARRRPGQPVSHPSVREAADADGKLLMEMYGTAERHGVKGFDKFTGDADYVTRVGNRNFIDHWTHTYGEPNVRRLVAEALQRKSTWLTPEMAERMARAWVRNVNSTPETTDVMASRLFDPSQSDYLRAILRKTIPSITDAEVEDTVLATKPDSAEAGMPNRARRRMEMDETHRTQMLDAAGNPIGDLGIEDLLENNSESLVAAYAHQIHGASALAEAFQQLSAGPNDPITTIPQLLASLTRDAEAAGLKADGPLGYKQDLAKIEVLAKLAGGIPLAERTAAVRAVRALRGLQFMRLLSSPLAGMQNFGEAVHGMSETGLRAVMKVVPTLGDIFQRGADGQLTNELGREIETMFGLGLEGFSRRAVPHAGAESFEVEAGTKAEELIQKGHRLAGYLSLMTPVRTLLMRLNGRLIAQRWADVAISGRGLAERRLAGIGTTKAMEARIADQIRTHALMEKGVTGYRVARLNMEQWTDDGAAAAFRATVGKEAHHLVHSSDPSEYAKWMTTETGKVISQLRTFAFAGWTNKLLYEVAARDVKSFINIGLMSMAGGLTYVARTYLDSVGKPDRDKFLKNRLSTASIAKATFSRSAWAALIPTAVDTVAENLGRKSVFAYARTADLSGSAILGNPTADWANAAWKLPGAIFSPALFHDYHFSRDDVDTIRKALFVPNVVGLNNIIDQMSHRLPRHSLPRNEQP